MSHTTATETWRIFFMIPTIIILSRAADTTKQQLVSAANIQGHQLGSAAENITRVTRHPVGVLMCQEMCQYDGCRKCVFVLSDLTCAVWSFGTEPSEAGRPLVITSHHDEEKLAKMAPIMIARDRCETLVQDKTKSVTAEFMKACLDGQVEVVKCIVSRELVDINMDVQNGRTPIMVAALYGHKSLFDYLVNQDCDLTARDTSGSDVLIRACQGGNLGIIKTLIDNKHMDIDTRRNDGSTPLLVVSSEIHGYSKVVKLLIARGCNVTAVDKHGQNALYLACVVGNLEVVDQLVPLLDLNSSTNRKQTPAMAAVAGDHVDVLERLVKNRCDLNAVDINGNSILHVACNSETLKTTRKLIEDYKLSTEIKGNNGVTPLQYSVYLGKPRFFQFLVDFGSNLNCSDIYGNTLLHTASSNPKGFTLVKELVNVYQFDSLINVRNAKGTTALIFAIQYGNIETALFLLNKGADASIRPFKGFNALHTACNHGHIKIVDEIISKNPEYIDLPDYWNGSALMASATKGHLDVFRLLIKKGANIHLVDSKGCSVLHIVASYVSGYVIVKQLVGTYKYDIDVLDGYGMTPLMKAAQSGILQTVKFLHNNGANPKMKDKNNYTILHHSSMYGRPDIVRYTLSHVDIDINCPANWKITPLMLAAMYGHLRVFQILSDARANMDAVDVQGSSMFFLACKGRNLEIVKLIVSLGKYTTRELYKQNLYKETPLKVATGEIKRYLLSL